MTDDLLLVNGIQHTLHCSLNVLDRLIDDLIQTNVHAFSFRGGLCHRIRTYVETDDDRIGCTREHDVGLVDGTNAAVDALHDYFLVGQLEQGLLHSLHATLNVRLHDQVQLLQVAFLDLGEQVIQ